MSVVPTITGYTGRRQMTESYSAGIERREAATPNQEQPLHETRLPEEDREEVEESHRKTSSGLFD